jgi:hypothetical protein
MGCVVHGGRGVRSCKNLPEKVDIWVDGKPLVLPPLTESFIILNINSHAGGVELWPDPGSVPERPRAWGAALSPPEGDEGGPGNKPRLRPSRFDDGMLEIVATTGVLHLGKIRVSGGTAGRHAPPSTYQPGRACHAQRAAYGYCVCVLDVVC